MVVNKQMEISIVLPVYNVVDYLDECIQSILNQTFDQFELIIVDDGSNDGSQIKCDQYKDDRITVVHQQNAGLAAARNTGIRHAKGKYITFIDSDDIVGIRYLEILYSVLINERADISICDYSEFMDNASPSLEMQQNNGDAIWTFNHREVITEVYNNTFHGVEYVSWAKMYRLDLFRGNDIWFPDGRLHEDTFTTYKLFYAANRIAYVDTPLYYYRKRGGSIMSSTFTERRLDMIDASREVYRFFMNAGEYDLTQMAFRDHLHKVKSILKMIYNTSANKSVLSRKVCRSLEDDMNEVEPYISIPLPRYLYYKGLSKFPGLFIRLK